MIKASSIVNGLGEGISHESLAGFIYLLCLVFMMPTITHVQVCLTVSFILVSHGSSQLLPTALSDSIAKEVDYLCVCVCVCVCVAVSCFVSYIV